MLLPQGCSRIITLGPQGTFSDLAAQRIRPPSASCHYVRTFAEALLEASERQDTVAVVPIENSVAGTVVPVQDALVRWSLRILGEINVSVRYGLLANVVPENAETLFAHPQAFEQTSDFQAHHLPEARPVFTDSNIDSGVRFLKEVDQPGFSGAAIVPLSFAEQNPDYLKQSDIQDYLNNTTRFLVVGPGQPEPAFDFTRTKTSVFIECSEDRAGLLYELLSVFNRFHINLCRLESRPSKKVPWMYVFYVDFYNSSETPSCLDALAASPFQFRILGSYDSLD